MKKHGCFWWAFIGWWAAPILLVLYGLKKLAEWPLKKAKATAANQHPDCGPQKRAEPTDSVLKTETHKVAGTSYRQDAIKSLGARNEDYDLTKKALLKAGLVDERIFEYLFSPQRVALVPEHENPYDSKAIKVVVDGAHIGYIKAGSCAHIHKLLRENRIENITCLIGGGREKELVPDDDIDGESVRYSLEKDEIPFYARLTITVKAEK